MIAIIQRHMAAAFGLAPRDLVSERKSRPIAEVRHLAVWLASEMTGQSLVRIGRAFAGRDHATVINSLEKAELLMERRPGLVEKMLCIRAAVEAEVAKDNEVSEAVMLTETVVVALRVALLELARRNPAQALAVILPMAERLAEGGTP